MVTTLASRQAPARHRGGLDRLTVWYAGAVVVGVALFVWAAVNQPYNQNELKQIGPYGSDSVAEITGGTRQPPLDALLGGILQHLLGVGQLEQRLVPVLSGIGSLVVVAVLFRRLGLGAAGALGLWALATAPLMVRYSAYTRPYALPLFLMLLFVLAVQLWFDTRRRRWLVVAALAAVALPLARVPEPAVFLLTTAAVLVVLTLRRRIAWSVTWPPAAIALGALVLVGYPMYRTLSSEVGGLYDPSPSGMLARSDKGAYELVTYFLPLLGEWFPWWPVTLLVVGTCLVVPASRRQLTRWWFLWPLLAAPVVFVLAYHFANTYPLDVRTYRPRFATFFLPGYVLCLVALASAVWHGIATTRRLRLATSGLLAAALLSQLPLTAQVLVKNEPADFEQVAEVLTERVPDEAIVLYDSPSPVGLWRQPFSASPRYMGDTPAVGYVSDLVEHPRQTPTGPDRPVYVLILDSRCSYSVVCDLPPQPWNQDVAGWEVEAAFDRFTLYRPERPLSGRPGVVEAMEDFGRAMTPRLGYVDTLLAARLLHLRGQKGQAQAVVDRMYADAEPAVEARIRRFVHRQDIAPFG